MKYGLVPKSAMVETFSSENTGKMSSLIGLKPVSYTHLDVYKRQHQQVVASDIEMVHQIFQLCVMQITIYQSVMSLTVIDFYIPEIQTARRYMYSHSYIGTISQNSYNIVWLQHYRLVSDY